jgi:hypothetical protein
VFEVHVYHHFPPDPEVLRRLDALEALLTAQGERMATQYEQLIAINDATNTRLDALQAESAEILVDLADVIARLQALPPTQDLTEAIAKAQAISDRVEATRSSLDARPPTPPPVAEG